MENDAGIETVGGIHATADEVAAARDHLLQALDRRSAERPETPELTVAEARTVFELEKRKGIYDTVQEILNDDQPVVFLHNPKELQAINAKVKNFPPMGYRDALQYLYEISIE